MWMWLFIAILTLNLVWEISTGRVRMKSGRTIYREDEPSNFWSSVWFETGIILLCLFFKCFLHHN